jgi:hypothetical protein
MVSIHPGIPSFLVLAQQSLKPSLLPLLVTQLEHRMEISVDVRLRSAGEGREELARWIRNRKNRA